MAPYSRMSKQLSIEGDGIILSEKLAKVMQAEVGDKVTLCDEDNQEYSFKVSGIMESMSGITPSSQMSTTRKSLGIKRRIMPV